MTAMEDPTLSFGFEDLDQVKVSPYTGDDAYGQRAYGTPVVYPGRVFRKTDVKFRDTDLEFTYNVVVYVDTSGDLINPLSKIEIVGDTTKYTVRQLDLQRDETGALHHFKVYLQ